MFIIVEGVDCSGKSTLINQLMRKANNAFHIRRSDVPKSADLTEIGRLKRSYKITRDIYKQVIQPNQGHLIVERFYPSEIVYSKVKRGYEAVNDKFYASFEEELLEIFGQEILLLHVFQEMRVLQERLRVRGDYYISEKDLSELNLRYLAFLEWTNLNVYSSPGDDSGIESAVNYINTLCNNDFNKELTIKE